MPRFVLGELQHIADDSDPARRSRGRRGLDVLSVLQKDHRVDLELSDEDVPEVKAVDAKLVALARAHGGVVLTTDYNLNRVAQLQGVRVMNLNQLANAMKPAFLPGEALRVKVIQEGKEPGQGVGYLDDGTMIVVEGGGSYLQRELEVHVTRVLQTVAGRMVFAQPIGRLRRPRPLAAASARGDAAVGHHCACSTSGAFADAVIVAAGSSSRMGGIDKSRAPIGGPAALRWAVDAMRGAAAVRRIIVVTAADRLAELAGRALDRRRDVSVVAGGARRQDSVAAGVRAADARRGAGP